MKEEELAVLEGALKELAWHPVPGASTAAAIGLELAATVRDLRKVLALYADEENWISERYDCGCNSWIHTSEGPEIAREALQGE
jgi:hypothetical protein